MKILVALINYYSYDDKYIHALFYDKEGFGNTFYYSSDSFVEIPNCIMRNDDRITKLQYAQITEVII